MDAEQQATLLRERTRDNKRLKENFDTLKNVNDGLKKEVYGDMDIGTDMTLSESKDASQL